MPFDVYSVLSFVGTMFDLFRSRSCKWSRRVVGVVLPEKSGKSLLCSALNGKRCVLIDLDEILKTSSENSEKIQRLKLRGEYQTLTLLLLEESGKLLQQIKTLHRHKRLVLVSSSSDLLEAMRINYLSYVPSNGFSEAIKSKLVGEEAKHFESSRMVLIQQPRHVVFNSFDELGSMIQERFELTRKL